VPINDVRLCPGAGFIYGLAGDVVTMPGLPSHPLKTCCDASDSLPVQT
jgi:formate--tetrahydrofolate ligase